MIFLTGIDIADDIQADVVFVVDVYADCVDVYDDVDVSQVNNGGDENDKLLW